ncbi:methyltransferase family protein [Bradyrhizobium sp. STM 3557]|uniref:methyltransferase family protein n=1 Tax=Bradyrhizobium sp. STM 3557 TaxID=578920 RepID=UPI00388E585D
MSETAIRPRAGGVATAITILVAGFLTAAVQFGLAIWAWGGWSAFFAHPALRVLALVTLLFIVVAMFSGSSGLSSGEREDRSDRWVLFAFLVIALLMAYVSAYTDRIDFWTIDGDAVRWFGVAVCVAGSTLRLVPVFLLKNRFSGLVAIQADHKLETRGIYAVIRNPSYLGMLVSAVGWALAFRSVVGVLLALLLLIPLVPRIHAEERLLREHFGKEYDDYFARTWRLVPWIY